MLDTVPSLTPEIRAISFLDSPSTHSRITGYFVFSDIFEVKIFSASLNPHSF